MKTTKMVLLGLLPLSFAGPGACAGGLLSRSGSSGTASTEQLRTRNQALDAMIVTALKPCQDKGKAEDAGLILVTAKPDGSLQVGQLQWPGSDEMKQCIMSEVPKARMQAWNGPSVTWLWSIGTKTTPAPKPLSEPPVSYREKQVEYVRRAQGNAGAGNDASSGPLAACAQRTLAPDAYALVGLRLFLFPDGKVAGATPIASDGDGKDAAFQDCVAEIPKEWTFEGFAGPGFTTLDIQLKHGINPVDK